MFNGEVKKTNLSLALQWYVLTERQILAQNLGIPKKQFTYQMMPKKKEGEAPGLRKAQCSSLGDYQDREAGRVWWGNREAGRGLGGGEIHERGNQYICK